MKRYIAQPTRRGERSLPQGRVLWRSKRASNQLNCYARVVPGLANRMHELKGVYVSQALGELASALLYDQRTLAFVHLS